LIQKLKIDAILLIVGIDTFHDQEMKKLTNWLLFGICGFSIEDSFLHNNFDDTFLVVSKDSLQIYTTHKGIKRLSQLSALIQNTNLYSISKSEQENSEYAEVTKIAKFYEYVHDKPLIGVPCRRAEEPG